MNDNRESKPPVDEMMKELDELYQFVLRLLDTYGLDGDAAGESVSTFERTVFYTLLFDGQLRGNGPDLWIFNGYAESDTHHVRSALDVLDTPAAHSARATLDALYELAPVRNEYTGDPSEDALKSSIIQRETEAYEGYTQARDQLIADLYRYATNHPDFSLERNEDAFEERRAPPGESYLPYVSQALRWCLDVQGRLEDLAIAAEEDGEDDQSEIIFDLVFRMVDLRNEIADAHEQERDGRNMESAS